MPTLQFWDKAPKGQWPVVKLVQEFYKEIYPAHPNRAFLYKPTALSEESYNELTRITPLVKKYAHSIMGVVSAVLASSALGQPKYSKAWCNKVFIDTVEEPFVPFTGRHHFFDVLD
ncbi:hypothetical protein PQX77_004845 [Marasmius sp. AFHP31]|nr:hypothetical protein PQX77_004845 [Marasmius sp. AFHP31]